MTVQNQNYQTTIVADGIVTAFVFDYPLSNVDDLLVTVDDVDAVGNYTVAYTVGDQSGTVNFGVAPLNLETVEMTRITPQTQDLIYPIGGAFPSKSHELAMDKLTMLLIDGNINLTLLTVINSRPAQRVISGSGAFVQDDEGKVVKYDGTGGHNMNITASLAVNTTITFKNIGTATITITAPAGGLTWLSGGGALVTGTRTLAVGAIVTIQMDETVVDAAEIWGNGIS